MAMSNLYAAPGACQGIIAQSRFSPERGSGLPERSHPCRSRVPRSSTPQSASRCSLSRADHERCRWARLPCRTTRSPRVVDSLDHRGATGDCDDGAPEPCVAVPRQTRPRSSTVVDGMVATRSALDDREAARGVRTHEDDTFSYKAYPSPAVRAG